MSSTRSCAARSDELASSAIEVPMGAAEGAELTKYCAPQMKRRGEKSGRRRV